MQQNFTSMNVAF